MTTSPLSITSKSNWLLGNPCGNEAGGGAAVIPVYERWSYISEEEDALKPQCTCAHITDSSVKTKTNLNPVEVCYSYL